MATPNPPNPCAEGGSMKPMKTRYPGIYRIGKNYFIDYYGPDKKRHREVAGSRLDDAVTKKEEIREQIRRGKYYAERKKYTTTFDELLPKYKEIYKDQKSFKTYKGFSLKPIEKFFSGKLLSQITPYDIECYKKLRKAASITVTRKKGDTLVTVDTGKIRSDASVNRELACLSHLFGKAVEWNMTEESPFRKMKGLFFKENNQRTRFLAEEEIRKLLEVEYEGLPSYLKPIIATAIYTGLRKGEILNLKWKDVDLERGIIYIRENKQNRLQIKYLNDDLIDLFMGLPVKGEYLFHEEGRQIKNVRTSFKTALKRAGIKDFRFHDLRHTSCSYMTMRGASPQAVQNHAGHSSMKMTMRYSHLSPAYQRDSIQLLNGLCGGILKTSEGFSEKTVKQEEVKQFASA